MPKVRKSTKKFQKSGALERELKFRKKVKPVRAKMKDAVVRKEKRAMEEVEQEEKEHIEGLRDLDQADPELAQFLRKKDPGLLEFAERQQGDDEDDEEAEEGEEEEEDGAADAAGAEDGAQKAQDGPVQLDAAKLGVWFKSMIETKSVKGIRRSVIAFRAAANQGFLGGDTDKSGRPLTHVVPDAATFEYIVATGSSHIPAALNHYLGRKRGGRPPPACPGWGNVQRLARNFLQALSMLIGSEGIPDASLAHLLRAAPPAVDYLSSFVPVARQLLKSCLGACAHSSEGIRVLAFVVVRAMAEPGKLPAPFTDVCMKGMYLTFVKNSRAFNPESYGVVSFLINQCVELCGVDLATAYQHVFVYVRQLAVYLRTALQSGAGEDAFRHVYNWQYVNSLRLWAMAVARYHDKRELYPLVYPICQIACGVVELFPSPKTFPLHLLVLGILNHLQRRTGVYVPTTMYLLRILSSPVFVKRFKGGGDSRPLDLAFTLRAKKADMANPHYHWAVLQETLYLLLEALALQAHCIGFPEFVYPVLSRLHKLRKQLMQADNRKFAGAVSQLSQRITAHRDWVLKRRKNVSFGPADTEKVAAWEAATRDAQPPLVQHYTSEKARREEQRKMKAEAAEGAHRKTIQEAAAEGESDDESLAGLAQAEDEDEASEEAVGDRELFGQAAEEITGPAAPPAAAAAAARPRPASAAGAAEAGAPRRKKRRRA